MLKSAGLCIFELGELAFAQNPTGVGKNANAKQTSQVATEGMSSWLPVPLDKDASPDTFGVLAQHATSLKR